MKKNLIKLLIITIFFSAMLFKPVYAARTAPQFIKKIASVISPNSSSNVSITASFFTGSSGTASSTLNGALGIGTTTPMSLLHVANVPLGNGTNATTTISFGSATTTSRVCINLRSSDGTASSLYVVGTNIIVEANVCR